MLTKAEWLFSFVSELRSLARGTLDDETQFLEAVSLQQWERLPDEKPDVVALRWATRWGLRGDLTESPPTMLIWLSECAEELQGQQPSLSRNVATALALLQWDMHRELSPTEAALHWLASRPHGPKIRFQRKVFPLVRFGKQPVERRSD